MHRTMTVFAVGVLFVCAFFLSPLEGQEQVQAPVYQVGDTWEVVYPNRGGEKRTITITEISSDGVVKVLDGGEQAVYDKDGNKIEGTGGAKWLSFPMHIGKKWSFDSYPSGGGHFAIEVKVAKFTKVTTKAGTFDAVLLESCWERKDQKGLNDCGFKYWYAPSVKRLIKREAPRSWAGGRWSNGDYELVSYKLVDAK